MIYHSKILAIVYGILTPIFLMFMISFVSIRSDHKSPIATSFSVLSAKDSFEHSDVTVFGYLPYWSLENIEFIQIDKLTDIAYFGLYVNPDGTIKRLESPGVLEPGYNIWKNSTELNDFIAKTKENNINFALTIISHDADEMDSLLSCKACWQVFTDELISELESKNIKDISIDFEHGDNVEEAKRTQFTQFVQFVNSSLDSHFGDSTTTVAVFADSNVKNRITKIDELSKVTDKMFIMAYDFHYLYSPRSGPVAPINTAGEETKYDINTMISDYLKNSPPNKLILGVSYYGYNWVVNNAEPYATRLEGNDYIGHSTPQTYENVMDTILKVGPVILWDNKALSPYFSYISPEYGSNRNVYFENKDSLKIKYELAKKAQFSGVGIWALGYDGGYQELWDLLSQEFVLARAQK